MMRKHLWVGFFGLVAIGFTAGLVWVLFLEEPPYGFSTPAIENAIVQGTMSERERITGVPILNELCDHGSEDRPDLVRAAIAAGADVNRMHDNHTPLLVCVDTARVESLKALLLMGADPTIKRPDGVSAFDLLDRKAVRSEARARMSKVLDPYRPKTGAEENESGVGSGRRD